MIPEPQIDDQDLQQKLVDNQSSDKGTESIHDSSAVPSIPQRENPDQSAYQLYKKRFLVLGVFALLSFVNGIQYSFYSPITTEIMEAYDIPLIEINASSLVYLILFVPASFFMANLLIEKYGTAASLYTGGALIVGCSWIRLLINQNFAWVIVGNILASIGQPFILNLPPKIANNWFDMKGRPTATTFGSVSCPVGVGLGLIFPILFVKTDPLEDSDQTKKEIFYATLYQAIFISAVVLITCLIFQHRPKKPPTLSAEKEERVPMMIGLKQLFKNKNFLLLTGGYCGVLTVVYTVTANVEPLITPYGLGSSDSAYIGMGFIFAGLLSAALHGLLQGYKKLFKVSLLLITIGGLVSFVLMYFTIISEIHALTYVAGCLMGLTMQPARSAILEFGCEMCYPIDETAIAGFLLAFGQLISVVMVIISGVLLEEQTKGMTSLTCAICLAFLAAGAIGSVFCKEELKRLDEDEKRAKISVISQFRKSSHMRATLLV